MAGCEVDGEREFTVGAHVPSEAVELAVANISEREALPGEAGGLPEQAVGADGGDGMEAGEEKQAGVGRGKDLRDGAERKVERTVGGEGVGEIGVAAGNCQEIVGTGAGPDAAEGRRCAKAEGAGREEAAAGQRLHLQEQSAAGERVFFAGDALRPGELARGSDERRGG